MTCPEEAGIGATPASSANAASDRRRPWCDQAQMIWAAQIGPMPGCSRRAGASSPTNQTSSFSHSAASISSAWCTSRDRAQGLCDDLQLQGFDGHRLALLDWGDSGVGHPLLDMTAFIERVPLDRLDRVRAAWLNAWRNAYPICRRISRSHADPTNRC